MRKLISISVIASLSFAFTVTANAQVSSFQYIKVDSSLITSQIAADGGDVEAFEGALKLSIPDGALKSGGRVEFMELELSEDSKMALPVDYQPISGIFEYQLRGTGFNPKFPLKIEIPFKSEQEFDKYLLRYDQRKDRWIEVPTETDLENGISSVILPFANAKFVLTELETMTQGHASWYRYKKCMCAASPDYPKGTKLLVTDHNKNNSIVVRVNDWGPERDIFPQRVIDLDVVAFEKLGSRRIGVLKYIEVRPFIAEKFDSVISKKLLAGEVVKLEPKIVSAAE